ncbi:MAG: shikimate kinase [Patescibacteria group bacterium]|nr:shikimate kinase [Patescibacteria group bacterium]
MMWKNLYLVAPMLSGKTKVGRILAAEMAREFVDLDSEIERTSGISIPEIFARYGQEHFRNLETAALSAAAKKLRCVVSTGGGAVCRPENRAIMKSCGVVVWLDVALPILLQRRERKSAEVGRPLADKLEKLFLQRRSIYEEVAHITVKVSVEAPAEEIAQRVLRTLRAWEEASK